MIRRHFGRGPLIASATFLFCCGTILAEEGPILPGLDAIPQSPPDVPFPSQRDAEVKTRRTPRPSSRVFERERPAEDNAANPPAALAPSANRSGARGLFPPKPADRAPLTRSSARPDSDRARSPGRAPNVSQKAPPNPKKAPSLRPAPLTDPWSAGRPQTDARTRTAIEREKTWRAGQNASPAANARAPRASSALPPKSPQTAPLGRQSNKAPRASSQTGQPSGNRLAR